MDTSAIAQFVPLILIFAIMYFLLIRPQQKKLKDHQEMVAALRRGDQIVTQGGLIGKVVEGQGRQRGRGRDRRDVKVRVVQSTIAQVLSKTEPAEILSRSEWRPTCCRSISGSACSSSGALCAWVSLYAAAERLLFPRRDAQRCRRRDRAAAAQHRERSKAAGCAGRPGCPRGW